MTQDLETKFQRELAKADRQHRKQLIKNSYTMGAQAFNDGRHVAPVSNKEFMDTVPNCEMGDDKGCALRIKMFKEYIKAWTIENLNKEWAV